jgi:hypothetical protein
MSRDAMFLLEDVKKCNIHLEESASLVSPVENQKPDDK